MDRSDRLSRKPRTTSGLEIREAGADLLVHDLSRSKVHVLNQTAGFILASCDGTTSLDTIARAISDSTGVTRETAERDLLTMVAEFDRSGLLA